MDSKTKSKIIQTLRKLTFSFKPRSESKNEQKVDKALFKCKKCPTLIYEGSSQDNFNKHKEKYPNDNIVMESTHMDHIDPIVDPKFGWQGWDSYIVRMFCEKDGWQLLCSSCHDNKSNKEDKFRVKYRKKKS